MNVQVWGRLVFLWLDLHIDSPEPEPEDAEEYDQ